jgi:hypothetical protein
MKVFVEDVEVYAPGIEDWGTFQSMVSAEHVPALVGEHTKYKPASLPRNEQRRATRTTRLAFRVAEPLAGRCDVDLSRAGSVFACSGGDYEVVDAICRLLAADETMLSPTHFHNSVHNAPGGYWGIATASHVGSSSISAGDDTFVAGLLEAVVTCVTEKRSTLFIAYDIAVPEPLRGKRPVAIDFGVAMMLHPALCARGWQCEITIDDAGSAEADHPYTALVGLNPIARSLPMLGHLALVRAGGVGVASTSGLVLPGRPPIRVEAQAVAV